VDRALVRQRPPWAAFFAEPTNRPASSPLSDTPQGQGQGRFRPELARQARGLLRPPPFIVVGPELQAPPVRFCQRKWRLELFKALHLSTSLEAQGHCTTIKQAKENGRNSRESCRLGPSLEDVISRTSRDAQPRLPRLHRLGIQAFEPVLVRRQGHPHSPARLHGGSTADFDGDQNGPCHIPLSPESQVEAGSGAHASARATFFSPAHGFALSPSPSQDMGSRYLLPDQEQARRQGAKVRVFPVSADERQPRARSGARSGNCSLPSVSATRAKSLTWSLAYGQPGTLRTPSPVKMERQFIQTHRWPAVNFQFALCPSHMPFINGLCSRKRAFSKLVYYAYLRFVSKTPVVLLSIS